MLEYLFLATLGYIVWSIRRPTLKTFVDKAVQTESVLTPIAEEPERMVGVAEEVESSEENLRMIGNYFFRSEDDSGSTSSEVDWVALLEFMEVSEDEKTDSGYLSQLSSDE